MKAKIVTLLTIICLSCSSNNCDDSDLATNFPLKFKIVSNDGNNQLLNSDFDESLLKILNPISSSNIGFDFSIQELNGELIIESQIVNTSNIILEYDGIKRFEVIISDRQAEIIDCTSETLAFQANSSDGTFLCNCDIDDFVVVTFDI